MSADPKAGDLAKFAGLSIAAAGATIALKGTAYYVTGSVGLLSDALESVVNLAAALLALSMLTLAARPAMSCTPTATARRSTSPAAPKGR